MPVKRNAEDRTQSEFLFMFPTRLSRSAALNNRSTILRSIALVTNNQLRLNFQKPIKV
jgi:hypothetical protein